MPAETHVETGPIGPDEVFGMIRPAATALVCGLVDPRMKIEIEVTARRRQV